MSGYFIVLLLLAVYYFREEEYFKTHKYLYVGNSNVHGHGIFTIDFIRPSTYLFTAIHKKKITPVGSVINHCNIPNTKLVKYGNAWRLISTRAIYPNEELLADYNAAPVDIVRRPDPSWTC